MACVASSVSGLTVAAKATSPVARRGVAANAGNQSKCLGGARSAVMGARVTMMGSASAPATRGMSVVAMAKSSSNPRGNSGGSRKGLHKYVERVDAPQLKDDLIPFRVGMTVKVGVTVIEGGKSRVQPYEGILIATHRAGVATTITVRKSFQGYGVERIFPIHSPLCTFEEIRGAGKPVVRPRPLSFWHFCFLSCAVELPSRLSGFLHVLSSPQRGGNASCFPPNHRPRATFPPSLRCVHVCKSPPRSVFFFEHFSRTHVPKKGDKKS
jgi:large subunit ribosomal protein L19